MSSSGTTTMEEESGRVPPQRQHHFVLVHGVCHGAWCWYRVATLLTSAGHRVTALDMAGCGASPARGEDVASFEDYSRPLLDTVAALPPGEQAVLVGHSFGGQSLALAMERYPDRVAVAVFVSAAMPAAGKPMALVLEEVRLRSVGSAYVTYQFDPVFSKKLKIVIDK
jgi:pimeloyl-ACP methyl ester carboxylesterase